MVVPTASHLEIHTVTLYLPRFNVLGSAYYHTVYVTPSGSMRRLEVCGKEQ